MSRILSSLALLSSLAVLAGGCASRTEVIISVETDISTLDQVEILVIGPSGTQHSATATFGASGSARTLGVTWSSGPLAPFVATVTGYRSGAVVLTRTAEFEFVEGQTRVVHVDLLSRCVGIVCGTQQTCGDAGCRPQLLGPSDYESYTGAISAHDAGPPSTTDAAMTMSMLDSGTTTPDTSSGCGNVTSDPNNCGSCGNVCMLAHSTAPTCASGRCQVGTCDTGFDNCDGRNSSGCEASLNTDTQNCGMCGHRCFGATSMCCNGTCAAGC